MSILPKKTNENNNIPALTANNIPQDLKTIVLWSCYRLVDNHDCKKPSKVPYNPVTAQKAAVNNTDTLCHYEICNQAVLSGHYDGLNFAFGHDAELVGIDLDNVLDDSREFTCKEAEEVFDRFKKSGAYIERSPSGKGLRIICKKRPETFVRFGKGTSLSTFEIYGKGDHGLHFLSVTGDAFYSVDSIPYCDDALSWFSNTHFYEKPTAQRAIANEPWEFSPELSDEAIISKLRNSKRKAEFEELFDRGHLGFDDSGDDLKLCSMIAFYVQDPEQIEYIFNQSALVRFKWESRPDYRNSTIEKAINGLRSTWQPLVYEGDDEGEDRTWQQRLEDHITDWNFKYRSALIGGKHRIMSIKRDKQPNKFIPETDFSKLYRTTHIQVGERDGNPVYKNHFKAWIQDPRAKTHSDVVFHPKKTFIDSTFNLWRGFEVLPAAGDWSIVKSHIRDILASGNSEVFEYILNWLAYSFQYPDKPAGTAIVIRGEKGTGKGSLGKFLMAIWGIHAKHISQTSHLVGNFNGHLQECCLLFADEAFFSGDKRHEGILKSLITEPFFMIERKGIDAVQQPNFLKILMATNSDFAVPASADERRYCVIDCSSKMKGNFSYFDRLHAAMDDRSVQAAFLHEMLNRDIRSYRYGRIPETKALQDQRLYSFKPHQEWVAECLIRGSFFKNYAYTYNGECEPTDWRNRISTAELFKEYEAWFKDKGKPTWSQVTRRNFGVYMKSIYKKDKLNNINALFLGSHREAITRFEEIEKVSISEFD